MTAPTPPVTELPAPAPPSAPTLRLSAEVDNLGIMLVVSRGRPEGRRAKPIAPETTRQFWRDLFPEEFSKAADAISGALRAGEISIEGHGVRVASTQTHLFDEAAARHLGLPELCPFPFLLQMTKARSGKLTISTDVIAAGDPPRHARLDGALVRFGPRTVYRAGSRIAGLLAGIEAFNAAVIAKQWTAYRTLSEYLPQGVMDRLREGRRVEVFQAGALGIDAVAADAEHVRVDPVLFAGVPRGPEDEEPAPLLSDRLQSAFVMAFVEHGGERRSYRISPTAAVVVDDSVEDCLSVVRALRRKNNDDRLAFLRDPTSHLAAAMRRRDHRPPLIAHGRYAPHVRGIGIWLPPSLPYLSRVETAWMPEEFIVVLQSGTTVLSSEEASRFLQAVEFARRESIGQVEMLDRTLPIAEAMLAWEQLQAQMRESDGDSGAPSDAAKRTHEHLSLIVEDNFDAVNHVAETRPRSAPEVGPVAAGLLTELKNHQTGGIEWLVDRWSCGAPAALLADDMGIGKTLQLLGFTDWIARAVTLPSKDPTSGLYHRPILVVVPATLVENWKKELRDHVRPDSAIGDFYEPSGAHLRAESQADISARVTAFGFRPVTLSTYEMLNEHLLVFGAVNWGLVALDEIQRIKDPATQLRNAVSGLNADFVVAATGTPIENRIEDLWSIVDAISPGRLGALRDFSRTHADLEIAKLRELSVDLLGPDLTIAPDAPPLMLRRFKEDVLDALPTKLIVPHEREMPPAQADAYARAVLEAKTQAAAGVREANLVLVQTIRRISLHPDGFGGVDVRDPDSLATWVGRSARTSLTFDILDQIRERKEKVLLYLDDLAVQQVLAQAIRTRFGLKAPPMIINGRVSRKRRKLIVDGFQQSGDGFVPIILSPRVGGVGLHLTAANHVIHVSRWWNPALEEQCNDRVHRMGQTRDIRIHVPLGIYPGHVLPSFDRLVDGLLADKRLLAREVLIPPVTGRETRDLAEKLRSAATMAFA